MSTNVQVLSPDGVVMSWKDYWNSVKDTPAMRNIYLDESESQTDEPDDETTFMRPNISIDASSFAFLFEGRNLVSMSDIQKGAEMNRDMEALQEQSASSEDPDEETFLDKWATQ